MVDKAGKQLVNKATFAGLIGCSRSYLSKKDVMARLAPAIEHDATGKVLINVELGRTILKRETDTSKVRKAAPSTPADDVSDDDDELEGLPAGSPLPPTMDAARRKNIQLKNEDLALKLAKEKGETLPRAGVMGAAAQAGQSIRENIFALIPGLAERFATMTDAREIRTVMDGELRKCFESVVNEFMRRIQPAGAGEGQPRAH